MNLAVIGINDEALAFAKIINCQSTSALKCTGIYSSNLNSAVKNAMKLNIKAYTKLDDAIRDADILLFGLPESKLADCSSSLKQMHMRNKILCHIGPNRDSSVLSCGTTNACYSIYLPYKYQKPQCIENEDELIMIEGGGKRSEEFEEALRCTNLNFVCCTPSEKRLSKIAFRIIHTHLKALISAAIHLFKIAGIYDKERFCSSIQKMVSEVCRNQKFEKSVVKIDAGEIKQNTKLLGTINSGDMKEYYKNLELHMAECDVYGQNEKIEILRSLGKMPRSKRSV